MGKKAIIIGAGPAGLTAAYELLQRTDIIPVILEKSGDIGGISRTINYKGNRMDMGPHRFFSKSDRVMDWWLKIMPLRDTEAKSVKISYQGRSRDLHPTDNEDSKDISMARKDPGKEMLVIQRLTRIYFLRKFFAYPIQLSIDTLKTLGLIRTIKIILSFLWIRIIPRKPEKNLEDFIINKFGSQLYSLFFKDYTEKVWGVPCREISAEWGAQRIKGVSLSKAVAHAVRTLAGRKGPIDTRAQKGTETSLIEQFLYPKHGAGSLWEEVARHVLEMGGEIHYQEEVQKIHQEDHVITAISTVNSDTGQSGTWEGDYIFSTMPVKDLIAGMDGVIPDDVQAIAAGLQYRDFINVGILLKQLCGPGEKAGEYKRLELKDNWIYIQENDVKVGRVMIYNNWGGGMIKDPGTTWIGMEYFCNQTDAFWALDDDEIQARAIEELTGMGLARAEEVLDATVRRMEKTYPAYFGTYHQFDQIRQFTDKFPNLFLVGRNGMHKYNNADHSMLTAMVAVDNIASGITTKDNIWAINTEQEYHEEKADAPAPSANRNPSMKSPEPTITPETPSPVFFPDYLWGNQWNRAYILCALVVFLIQFILFKIRYPFANYMPDSYSYLDAAARNVDVNMWPVAYSKFLRLVSAATHSDAVVVGFQYWFMQASSGLFIFTLFYFLKPGKWVKNLLMAFFLLNPITLYVSNYISADALFIGMSLLWLTSLIWIVYRPKPYYIFIQGLLLLACFTIRYNAIYYPFITALAYMLSRQPWKWKLAGIGLGFLLVFASYTYTSTEMQEQTGKRQFSAFGGWQLANNALYMYQDIPANERGPVPARFAKLETMVREHMDTLKRVKFTKDDSAATYFYLWSSKGPLVQYMARKWKKDSTTSYFKRWAAEGPLYRDYALYLVRRYPLQFAETFLLPNAIKYAVPPTEFLGIYNMGGDSVGKLAKDWFNYKNQRVSNHNNKDASITATEWYPIFSALVNVLLLIALAGLLVFSGFRQKGSPLPRLFLLILGLWLLNMMFSIFASPVVLRYQVFPVLISFCLAVTTLENIYRLGRQEELTKKATLS